MEVPQGEHQRLHPPQLVAPLGLPTNVLVDLATAGPHRLLLLNPSDIKLPPPTGYRQFWESLAGQTLANGRPVGTATLLDKLSLTADQALVELALPTNSCLNYYLRGTCNRRNCTRQHPPNAAVAPTKASSFLQRLKTAKAKL